MHTSHSYKKPSHLFLICLFLGNVGLIGSLEDFVSTDNKGETQEHLETFRSNGQIVETEGLLGCKQLVKKATERNQPVIVLGLGDGATTIVNAIQDNLCSAPTNSNENEKSSVEESSDSDSDAAAYQPYVLFNPGDWNAVDLNKPAVIAIHDPSGTIQTDMKLLDKMFRHVDQCLSARRDIIVLIAMKKFPDFDASVIMEKYGDFVVDLQSQEYLISETPMKNIFENFMKRYDVKYTAQTKMKDESQNERSVTYEATTHILKRADKRGFVKELTRYFEKGDLTKGTMIFNKPDDDIVKQIMTLFDARDPECYTLLAVNDHGGELSKQKIEEIRRYQMKTRSNLAKNSLALKFARANKCQDKLGDLLLEGLERLVQTLLEKKNRSDIYRFRSGKVWTSLMIVLASHFPQDTLLTCDDDFISQYVLPRSPGSGRKPGMYVVVEENNADGGVMMSMLKRITNDLLNKKISMYTKHPLFAEPWFVDKLFKYWSQDKFWKVLLIQESALNPYCLLYFGLDQMFTVQSIDGSRNVAEKVLKQKIWKTLRSPKRFVIFKNSLSKLAKDQEHATMMRAIELGMSTTVRMLVDMGMAVTEGMYRKAMLSGQTEVVNVFKEVATFPYFHDVLV